MDRLGGSAGGESARSRGGALGKKNRHFLDGPMGVRYCFSELSGQGRLALLMGAGGGAKRKGG
jgi:hypothetical protein